MRRIGLLALAATAIVVFPTSALSSGAHHKQKSAEKSPAASYKSGIYSALIRAHGYRYFFGIRLANGKASINALPPALSCGSQSFIAIGDFAAPSALSASGSVTEHGRYYRKLPEQTLTGSVTFTVTFTKHRTATGDFEASLTGEFRREPFSCNSGKVPFTAKLRWTLADKPIHRLR